MEYKKKQTTTTPTTPDLTGHETTSAAHPAVLPLPDVTGTYPPPFENSRKMDLYRASFRESFRSPRESVTTTEIATSTPEEDVMETATEYPPPFDKSRKMDLYRGSFRESFRSPRKSVNTEIATSTSKEDVMETATEYPPPFENSRKMDLYRGSCRESFRSPRESVTTTEIATSTSEEDVMETATNYPPPFENSRKMDLYRGSIKESEKLESLVYEPNSDYCIICRDFSVVDTHAANFPRQFVTSIPDLASDLCDPFAAKVDKARAIFTWLHHNITYDVKSYFQDNVRYQSPEETIRSGVSVCQGYAELFEKLAFHAGLDVITISGHGKGYGYNANSINDLKNHAWNAVKLDSGQWQLVDSCWGAGSADENQNFIKEFNASLFTSSPETFRLKHFPSDPKYQFCEREMSWDEYIMVKEKPLFYDEFFTKEFSEETIQPKYRIIKPERTKFVITTKCAHTFIQPEDQYVLLLCIDEVRIPFQVDSTGSTWMCEIDALKEGRCVIIAFLETFGERDARGVTVEEFLNNKTKGYSWCYVCSWDVKR